MQQTCKAHFKPSIAFIPLSEEDEESAREEKSIPENPAQVDDAAIPAPSSPATALAPAPLADKDAVFAATLKSLVDQVALLKEVIAPDRDPSLPKVYRLTIWKPRFLN